MYGKHVKQTYHSPHTSLTKSMSSTMPRKQRCNNNDNNNNDTTFLPVLSRPSNASRRRLVRIYFEVLVVLEVVQVISSSDSQTGPTPLQYRAPSYYLSPALRRYTYFGTSYKIHTKYLCMYSMHRYWTPDNMSITGNYCQPTNKHTRQTSQRKKERTKKRRKPLEGTKGISLPITISTLHISIPTRPAYLPVS